MPHIRVTVVDDHDQQTEQTYALPGQLDTLDEIDEAVEQFKNQVLPTLEKELLSQSQERLAAQEKKTLAVEQRA